MTRRELREEKVAGLPSSRPPTPPLIVRAGPCEYRENAEGEGEGEGTGTGGPAESEAEGGKWARETAPELAITDAGSPGAASAPLPPPGTAATGSDGRRRRGVPNTWAETSPPLLSLPSRRGEDEGEPRLLEEEVPPETPERDGLGGSAAPPGWPALEAVVKPEESCAVRTGLSVTTTAAVDDDDDDDDDDEEEEEDEEAGATASPRMVSDEVRRWWRPPREGVRVWRAGEAVGSEGKAKMDPFPPGNARGEGCGSPCVSPAPPPLAPPTSPAAEGAGESRASCEGGTSSAGSGCGSDVAGRSVIEPDLRFANTPEPYPRLPSPPPPSRPPAAAVAKAEPEPAPAPPAALASTPPPPVLAAGVSAEELRRGAVAEDMALRLLSCWRKKGGKKRSCSHSAARTTRDTRGAGARVTTSTRG